MANSKFLKYVLVTGTAIVWGTVFYKVIAGMQEPIIPVSQAIEKPVQQVVMQDSFYLYANYPDPFIADSEDDTLSKLTVPVVTTIPVIQNTPPIHSPVAEIIDISFIKYHGSMYNPSLKTKIALVNMRGSNFLVKENETVNEVLFKKIGKESIIVLYKGKKFEILKT